MARCPSCRRHFRTLDDEEGLHDCPFCGEEPYPQAVRDADEEPEDVFEALFGDNTGRLMNRKAKG